MILKQVSRRRIFTLLVLITTALTPALLAQEKTQAKERPVPSKNTILRSASPESCALLDDPRMREQMDGLLFNLLWSCGREDELGDHPEFREITTKALFTSVDDRPVNDPSGEVGASATQSETSMTESGTTGTLCSAFNDSWEFFGPTGGGGLTGFSRSTDGGLTWQDGGAIGGQAFGDPSLVWREADSNFYLATLESGGGLAFWVSTDDCQSFSLRSIPSTFLDDKEFIAVDNNAASPHYGNLYLTWKEFGIVGAPIRASRSTDGGFTWTAPTILATGNVLQGPWPATAPNGDVFIAWLRYTDFLNGPVTVEVSRSINGGLSYFPVTSPLVNAVSPRDLTATLSCSRPALRGNIRYLASPQITVDEQGTLHIVYSYDPDGFNVGDVVDVFYRRSIDSGATWSTEIRLNDDNTLNDQYFPTIQTSGDVVMATWYDRRDDHDNLKQDYFKRVSEDLGLTWYPSVKVSDVSSPIVLDPSLNTCYHGDYDQSLLTKITLQQIVQWADDRSGDADVHAEPGNCFEGQMTGSWFLPTLASGNQTFTSVLKGKRADPPVYNLTGTATPIGTISGTLAGTDPNSPGLTFSGKWRFNSGAPLKGTFRAKIFDLSGTKIGNLGASWKQNVLSQPGRHSGTWEICLP